MFKKIRRYAKDPYYAFGYDLIKTHPMWMSDKFYVKVQWWMIMGYELDLHNPRTFNEKLQWLKLYDRNPLYTELVDKYRVKDWVAAKIGSEYVIPTLKMYKTPEEIDLNELPEQFVLKCNHDSGSVIICKNKALFDLTAAKQKLSKCINHNFYKDAREWAYKNVKPVLFAEKFMYEEGGENLMDYKFFCFNGMPRVMYMSRDHAEHCTTDFFDMEFNRLPIRMQAPNSDVPPQKPKQFEELKRLASILSEGIPQVRVDFYVVDGKIYFGEMTFYHCAGLAEVKPSEWNSKLGDMICLPQKYNG